MYKFLKKVLKLRLGIISILKIGISHATNNIVIPFLSVFFWPNQQLWLYVKDCIKVVVGN